MKWNLLVKNYRANKMLYWMILPAVAFIIIFCYVPMSGLVVAFQDYSLSKGIWGSKWIGLKNFEKFFGSIFFSRTLWNTVALSALDLLFSFPAPILLALLLNEVRCISFKRTIQTLSYVPHFISTVIVASLILEFTSSDGVIASIVSRLGGTPRSYISMPQYFRTIFVISNIWQTIGFNSIVYLGALTSISDELYEATRIDGANRFQQVLHVTLPGVAPTIIIMLILRSGQILNVNYEKILLLYSPATYDTADVIMTYVYRMGIKQQKYGYSTAVGLFNSVVGLIFVLFTNKMSKTYTEISMF